MATYTVHDVNSRRIKVVLEGTYRDDALAVDDEAGWVDVYRMDENGRHVVDFGGKGRHGSGRLVVDRLFGRVELFDKLTGKPWKLPPCVRECKP